jgi:hypothetical protein
MLGGIALTVWQGAHAKADGPVPGQKKVGAGAPQTLIKPSSGAPQSATPRAVCTFASIGLYWTPDGGADDKTCRVRYRAIGEPAWREALPLWFDLISGKVVSAGKQESHGVVGVPVYATSRPAGDFSLAPGSPGFDAGVPIPNFNDGFHGRAPDMGACEAGAPPLEFGVNAYRDHASRGRQSK